MQVIRAKLVKMIGAFVVTSAYRKCKKSRSLWGSGFYYVLMDQWNCSSSVEPVSAVTEDLPPWITVVMSSK